MIAAALALLPAAATPAQDGWDWSFGGELRARYERYANDEWGAAAVPDHDYAWWRALPFVEGRHVSGVRVRAQLIAAFESGDEAGLAPVDEDRLDVLEAFGDVPVGSVTMRAGRQVLALGSERLISARYGPNVPRAFDAVGAVARAGPWQVDALWGRPVVNEPGAFDDAADDSTSLWTVYATRPLADDQGLDVYAIGLDEDEATFDEGTAAHRRLTLGTRVFGSDGPWDWNFELMGQTGAFGGGDVRAWSFASDTGRVLASVPLRPRLGLRANVISGDDEPGDGELETFDPLFPKGKYFGEAGLIGPYNLVNVHPSLDVALSERWTLSLASVLYWRESTGDGIYGNAGQLLRPSGGSSERFVGSQFDAALAYRPSERVELSVGWSTFLPGAFVDDTGPDETVRFLGVELRIVR